MNLIPFARTRMACVSVATHAELVAEEVAAVLRGLADEFDHESGCNLKDGSGLALAAEVLRDRATEAVSNQGLAGAGTPVSYLPRLDA